MGGIVGFTVGNHDREINIICGGNGSTYYGDINIGCSTTETTCFRGYDEEYLLFKPLAWCGKQWRDWSKPLEPSDSKVREVLKKIAFVIPLILATIGASFIGVFGFFCPETITTNSGFNPGFVFGSGEVVKKEIDLNSQEIRSLKLGLGEVTVKEGKSNSLIVQADENCLALLSQRVEGNQLILGARPNSRFQTSNKVQYTLTVATPLKSLIVSGSGGMIIDSGLDPMQLNCTINGSGSVTVVKGRVQRQIIKVSGSGNYSALNLATENSQVSISGSGHAHVQTSQNLSVGILGSGTCYYSGNPKILKQISGSGRLIRI